MATIGTFRQPGSIITVKASTNVAYHELLKVGSIYAVAKAATAENGYVACDAEGVFQFPKKAAEAITQGTKVYLDESGAITATAGTDPAVGVAWSGETADSTSIDVKINV